jgi:hypothetical protein
MASESTGKNRDSPTQSLRVSDSFGNSFAKTVRLTRKWPVHVLAIIGRVAAGCVAALAFYMAFFMYEDEQGRWQNRLNEFWVRVDDRAKITGRTSTALWNKISELVVNFLNKTFGKRLFSARSVIASVNLSFVIIWVCLIIVLITSLAFGLPDRPSAQETKTLPLELLFLASLSAYSIKLSMSTTERRLTSRIVPMLSVVVGLAVMLYQVFISSSAKLQQTGSLISTGSIILSLLLSIASDVLAIVVIRKVLALTTRTVSVSKLIAQGGILLLLVLSLAIGPLVLMIGAEALFDHLIAGQAKVVSQTVDNVGVAMALFNMSTILYCCVPLIMALVVILHRMIWPAVAKGVYPLCQFKIVTNRKALIAVGSVCVIAAIHPSALNLEKLLTYVG